MHGLHCHMGMGLMHVELVMVHGSMGTSLLHACHMGVGFLSGHTADIVACHMGTSFSM